MNRESVEVSAYNIGEMLFWIFDHCNSWREYVTALADCGFSKSEVCNMAINWGVCGDEEEEITKTINEIYGEE